MDELVPFINFAKSWKYKVGKWTGYKHATLGQHIEYCEAHIKKCEDLIKKMQDQLQQENAIESLRTLSNINVAEDFNEIISNSLESELPSKRSRASGESTPYHHQEEDVEIIHQSSNIEKI